MKYRRMVKDLSQLSFGLALLVASLATAAIPATMTYSGTLLDSDGRPVTGQATLVFRLYAQPSGGSSIWEEMVTVAPDSTGWFVAQIGAAIASPLDPKLFRQALWLGIQVAADQQEMSPRVALSSAPYALSVDALSLLPACAPGQVLQYQASGWGCASGSPIVVSSPACGASRPCAQTSAGDATTVVTVNTVSITTPGPGTIVVDFGGVAQCTQTWYSDAGVSNLYQASIIGQITDSNVTPTLSDGSASIQVPYSMTGAFVAGSINAHRAFKVAWAGTYSYSFKAVNLIPPDGNPHHFPASCSFVGDNMTGIYYP